MTTNKEVPAGHRISSFIRMVVGVVCLGALGGCVTSSWVGRKIVHPPQSGAFRALARPFYARRITLAVPPPDGGTINAAVIDPAPYDPILSVGYRKNRPGVSFSIDFAHLLGKCKTRCYKHDRISYSKMAVMLRARISRIAHTKPIGTIILLTGWGMGKATLLPWALYFASWGWRTILVDLRGQGDAQAPDLTWGLRDRQDLKRLIAKLKHERLLASPWVYFGVSYGAGVALMASARKTEPDGVIAVSPWSSIAKVIVRFSHSSFVSDTVWSVFDLIPGPHSRVWPKALHHAGQLAGVNLAKARPAAWVGRIRAPVLYLGGTADRIAPPSSIQRLARNTPHAVVVIRPFLDHASLFADVPGFCRPIVRWLSHTVLKRPVHAVCRIKTQVRKNRIREQWSLPTGKKKPAEKTVSRSAPGAPPRLT